MSTVSGPAVSRGMPSSRKGLRWSPDIGWIALRVGFGLLTLFVVTVVIFLATQILPGDVARIVLGRGATPEAVEAMRASLGLDQSAFHRYTEWLGGVLTGDFGTSLTSGTSVADQVFPPLLNTLSAVAVAVAIGFPLAGLIGTLAARKPGGILDGIVSVVAVVISAVPEFVVALLVVALLSTSVFTILPAVSLIPAGESPWSHPDLLVLPVITLVIVMLPYLTLQVRASVVEALRSEYVVMAELKGLSRRTVLYRHALPNGLQPAIQAGGLSLAYLLGGTVVIEYIFQYPGIGLTLVNAVTNRDIPIVQASVLVLATLYVVINLIADILTVFVTPTVRTR
ncbi:ABC transporter permease [Gordonia sp. NPDC003376]